MKHELANGTLTLFLPERIDTSSVHNVEQEMGSIIRENPHQTLVFDAADLLYISSVGLRLKWKKDDPTLSVTNACNDVYDIFEMTGFTQIIPIQKKFREISIEGCPLIGKGAYGKVYRLSPDTIVKSFYRGNPLSDIERERNLAKQAFILGIPTAISYDVVKIKEEKLGAVYELIASDSLLDTFIKKPEDYDTYLKQYIRLLDQMRNTRISDSSIPSYKVDLKIRLDRCEGFVDERTLLKMRSFIDSLPDGDRLLHGDCHFKNIFVTPDGLLLIDMDTLSKGDPIYELACLFKTYITFDEIEPGNANTFFGVDSAFCHKLFDDVFNGLVPDDHERKKTRAKVEAIGWFMYVSHCCRKGGAREEKIDKSTAILKQKLAAI